MKVAFWLIPAEPDRTIYQFLINDLAHQYNAPIFTPHVTVHSCDCEQTQAIDFLNSHSAIDIVLEVDQIRYSEQFTKTLYIQLFSNSKLEQFSELLRQEFDSSFVLDPHLSLIYASLSETEKQSHQIPLNPTIRFDRMSAIAVPSPVRTREDVEAWEFLI